MALPDMVALWLKGDNVVIAGENGYVPLLDGDDTADPVDVLSFLSQKYERFLLLDLDGVERGKPQLELFQDCSEIAEIWVDAGVVDAEDASDITVSGASMVICGTKSLRSWDDLEKMTDTLENIIFSLDVANDVVAPFFASLDMDAILDEATTLPLAGGILMDIKGTWTTPEKLKELSESFKEFYFSSSNAPEELEDNTGRIISLDDALRTIGGTPPWT